MIFSVTQSVSSPAAAESPPAAEQPFHFQPSQPMMSPDDCAAQPGVSAPGEMCYNELPDSTNGNDATAIFNQLLDMPEFCAMIFNPSFASSINSGFEPGTDINSTLTNMDLNFNQNFSLYPQDFSQYNDFQFNRLVNENQTPQSEAQDSTSSMVQVKTEEEL